LVAACVVVAWIQLHPWHTASVIAADVESELERLIPVQERPQEMVWYVNSVPDRYRGAWVLNSGISRTRYMPGGGADIPRVVRVDDVTQAPLGRESGESFALSWEFDPTAPRWHVSYGLGITSASAPPTPESNTGSNLQVWDFRSCQDAVLKQWEVDNASASCEPDRGLLLNPTGVDPQLANESLNIAPSATGDRYVRVRVSFAAAGSAATPGLATQLYWSPPGGYFSESRQRRALVPLDGAPHVFWAFLAPHEVGQTIAGLRFDPVDSPTPVEVRWIAVDTVR
jgi:hypothetical protein